MKAEARLALKEWETYRKSLMMDVGIDLRMTIAERNTLRKELEADPVKWMQYFFPGYAKYPFAPFQLDFIRRIVGNPETYEVISWSRELAKSTVTFMLAMYLALTGKKRNIIVASATEKSAVKLLKPYKEQMEYNSAIRVLYGQQPVLGQWKDADFACACGCSFLGLGAGNSPRGTRNGAVRPDMIVVDDFDTDEDCRNPMVLDAKWDWWQRALYPTRSVSEPTTIIFCGNIIAQDCCVKRAGAVADHWDIINIRDAEGHSSWPAKNTEEKIDRIAKGIDTRAFQAEYYNNPIAAGKIFLNLTLGPCPPLSSFKYLICYGDPSYSNNKSLQSSMKALALMGKLDDTLYIIRAFVAHCTNSEFIAEYFRMRDYVNGESNTFYYMENNKLQDPFYTQVFMPLLREECRRRATPLYIKGDGTKKTDKATRIEANLGPLDREGRLIFNSAEKDSLGMKEMINQFEMFDLQLPYCADGPDAVEGGLAMLAEKEKESSPVLTSSLSQLRKANRIGW